LLLSDVQMPRMDGWQLVRILRARTSLVQVPIVLLTTLTDDEARLQGYSLGVDDYIGKPVSTDELAARVDRIVERTQQLQPRDRRSLRGDLEHVALVPLLSFLAVERKTGLLLVVGDATARLYLRGGQPLRVDIDDVPVGAVDDPALAALFGWKRGRFEFTAQEIACADELHTTVNALILEHTARANDE
ncbi:MAG TPA: response regulator, partial [Polyangia bacterium]|nr:response regulator [Polyangia bacterium]